MKKSFYLRIFFIVLYFGFKFTSENLKEKEACYMPEGCAWHKPSEDEFRRNLYCKKFYARFNITPTNSICMPDSRHASYLNLHYNWNGNKIILNNSFQLFQIANYVRKMSKSFYHLGSPYFSFYNLRGVDVNLRMPIEAHYYSIFQFFDSSLDMFTSDGSLIRTCEQYREFSAARNFIFSSESSSQIELTFSNCRVATPICRLVFRNARLSRINFLNMAK